jgi:hypothetical protein
MLPQPVQIALVSTAVGCARRKLNDMGSLKEADELPNHADESFAQNV